MAGGSSLLEPKNQPMNTDATYETYDKWNNYALEWYQVVLGCLRVHKNVFKKIDMSEVNFSHRPKITIRWVGPNAPIFVHYKTYSLRGVILAPLRPLEKISDPQNGSLKQYHGTTNLRQYFADLLETFGCKKLF